MTEAVDDTWARIRQRMCFQPATDFRIGLFGGCGHAAGTLLVDFDRKEKVVLRATPVQCAVASAAHTRSSSPNLQRGRAIGLQVNPQIARIIQLRWRIGESDHGEHVVRGQGRLGIGAVVHDTFCKWLAAVRCG